MKLLLAFLSIILPLVRPTAAEPIPHILQPFPDGTVIYKALGSKLSSVSALKSLPNSAKQQFKFTFEGKWELHPDLKGVVVSPDAGVIILAETKEEKAKLAKIQSMLKERGNRKIDIYVLSRSTNKNRVTYSGTETIRFE